MNMQNISYAFPAGAYLFLVVAGLSWMFWRLWQYRTEMLENFASPNLWWGLLIPRSIPLYIIQSIAVCIAWICATFALMNPHGSGKYPLEMSLQGSKEEKSKNLEVKVRQKAHEVIILLDASASMSIADTRSNAKRLELAKEIADSLLSRLRGESVSLYAFTSELSQESPATMNYLFVRLMLRQIAINEGGAEGTDINRALEGIRKRYFTEKTPWAKTLIVLSDGGDTRIESLQGSERQAAINAMLEQLNDAGKHQMRVFTIGIGSHEGGQVPEVTFEGKPVHSSLNEEILRKISQKGQGTFYNSNDYSSLDLSADLIKKIQANVPITEKQATINTQDLQQENLIHTRYYQIPLGLAILFLALSLILPDAKRRLENAADA